MGTTVDPESAGMTCGLRNHMGAVLQNAPFADQSPSASSGGARDIQKHCFRERGNKEGRKAGVGGGEKGGTEGGRMQKRERREEERRERRE